MEKIREQSIDSDWTAVLLSENSGSPWIPACLQAHVCVWLGCVQAAECVCAHRPGFTF